MVDKFDKTIPETKKLRLFKGGRKEDIYDVCKEKRPIDINGELIGEDNPDPAYESICDDWDVERLRWKAWEIVSQITNDPLELKIAELMLDYGYTEKEVAKILKVSPARVEWFIRKIEGWKRMGGKK